MISKLLDKIPVNIKSINEKNRNLNSQFETTEIELKVWKKTRILLLAANLIIFSISLLLIIIGIIYLSIYFYAYSFTTFTTTLVAGLFIAIGALSALLTFANLGLAFTNRNYLALSSVAFICVMYLVLLAIGIWGVSISTSSQQYVLNENVRQNYLLTVNAYDEKNLNKYETKKIDWLQGTFKCCGLNSYVDWQSFYLYGGIGGAGGGPVYNNHAMNWNDKWSVNNNLPYVNNVPDSCCIQPQYNCGKQFTVSVNNYDQVNYNNNNNNNNQQAPFNSFNRQPNSYSYNTINTNGCLQFYLDKFSTDVVFLSVLSIVASCIVVLLFILLVLGSIFIRKSTF